jgi:hypothetical protein
VLSFEVLFFFNKVFNLIFFFCRIAENGPVIDQPKPASDSDEERDQDGMEPDVLSVDNISADEVDMIISCLEEASKVLFHAEDLIVRGFCVYHHFSSLLTLYRHNPRDVCPTASCLPSA